MADLPEAKWVLTVRRRRFRISDLMVGVALTALAIAPIAAVELPSEKQLVGTFGFAFLALLVAQRGIAGISGRRFCPAIDTFLGVLSCVIALSMFMALVVMGLIIPQGAALLSVAMLLLVVYLTTWD